MLKTSSSSIKILWVVGSLFSVTAFAAYAIMVLLEYLSFNVSTEFEYEQKDFMIFPAATICLINQKSLNANLFEEAMVSCDYGYELCNMSDFHMVKYSLPLLGNHSFTCFKFNGAENSAGLRKIENTGKDYGLRISLMIPDYTEIIYFIGDNPVHPVIEDFETIFPGAIYFITVEKHEAKRLSRKYNLCLKKHQFDSSNSIYLQRIIQQNQTYRRINCMSLCLSDNNIESKDVRSYCSSICPYECDTTDFKYNERTCDTKNVHDDNLIRIQNSIPGRKYANMSLVEMRNKLTVMNIYFKTLICFKKTQVAKMTVPGLVSNIGGLSGLFLEMSFVSGYRFFQFLIEIFIKS